MNNKGKPWTREETMLAFELYCIIPKGKDTIHNEHIKKLAVTLGRSADSVKLKLQNFKSCDPSYTSDGRKGLSNVSKIDKEVCDEFLDRWDEMLLAVDKIKVQLGVERISTDEEVEEDYIIPTATNQEAIRKVRIGQSFFSRAVRCAYEFKCCITNINIPELLIASHIKPWRDSNDINEKANPRNGLLLNSLHDAAFDKGYISIDRDYRVMLSSQIINSTPENRVFFDKYKDAKIALPLRFLPDYEFIQYHNDVIFKG